MNEEEQKQEATLRYFEASAYLKELQTTNASKERIESQSKRTDAAWAEVKKLIPNAVEY